MAVRRSPGPRNQDFGYEEMYEVEAPPYAPPPPDPADEISEPVDNFSYPPVTFSGFEPSKMNAEHAQESPKYAFQQVFGSGGTWEDLQKQYPDFFKDWQREGDKIFYRGSGGPHEAFNGITGFDIQIDTENGGPFAWQPLEGFGGAPSGAPPGLFNGMSGFGGFGSGNGQTVGSGSGGGSSSSAPMFGNEVMNQLRGLFPNGAFNQDVVNRRTEIAAEDLHRAQLRRHKQNQALLANRGLVGEGDDMSGPELTALGLMNEDIGDQYGNAVSGIYADESARADDRMIQALSIAAGMTMEEAKNALGWGQLGLNRELGLGELGLGHRRAGIEETLGLGNLALGNMNAVNAHNLALGRFGLDRDMAQWQMQNGGIDQLIALLNIMNGQNNTSAGGFI